MKHIRTIRSAFSLSVRPLPQTMEIAFVASASVDRITEGCILVLKKVSTHSIVRL